jgi:hypothetical protein
VIVSIQLTAAQADNLRVGAPDGPRLGELRLPYPLREDI